MSIRCAHCKGRHETVAEVRGCSVVANIHVGKPTVPLVAVVAKDMLHAQGWSPTTGDREVIKQWQDYFESKGLTRHVEIAVHDCYTGARIGSLIWQG